MMRFHNNTLLYNETSTVDLLTIAKLYSILPLDSLEKMLSHLVMKDFHKHSLLFIKLLPALYATFLHDTISAVKTFYLHALH